MKKHVDLCSAVEFTAAHSRSTKSPEEEEITLLCFFSIGASITFGQEILCLPYAGFFFSVPVERETLLVSGQG